jgi:aspartate kinase
MSAPIVCKFGGTSVADANQIEKIRRIVAEDDRRRVVVVSAPGKGRKDTHKATDHLLNIATAGAELGEERPAVTVDASREAVLEKFATIVEQLGIDGDALLAGLREDLDTTLTGDARIAFLASRGEHYNARIVARHFERSGMAARAALPETFDFRVEGPLLDARITAAAHENAARIETTESIAVIPGYYGVTEDGEVAVFSRGGSDLTGGEIAFALDAHRYENWTDVSGVYEVDPRVVSRARPVPRLTYKELRLLSVKGLDVFHLDAMLACKQRRIPIHIRNTNATDERGTVVLDERVPEEGIVGIARLDSVAYLYLERDELGAESSFVAELLSILQDFGITTYHFPTDKDDIAVLIDQDDLRGNINELRRRIEARLAPDHMGVEYNIAVLTPVGLGLKGDARPIVDALRALTEAHIPIEMIDQSPSQLCFHIGVRQAVADDAMELLYRTLIEERGR